MLHITCVHVIKHTIIVVLKHVHQKNLNSYLITGNKIVHLFINVCVTCAHMKHVNIVRVLYDMWHMFVPS